MDGKDATGKAPLSAVKQALLARRIRELRAAQGAGDAIVARPDRRSAPLAFEQEPLWALEQRDPGRSTYNVAVVRRLRGAIDAELLRAALGEVVARHEALRTTLADVDGSARQIVHPAGVVALSFVDAAQPDARAAEAAARALFARDAATPFDLGALPLLRVTLVRIGADEHLLQLVAHHLIFDGGSTAVFFTDLDAAYVACQDGRATARAPLTVHYPDFAHWQRTRYANDELERLAAYWRDELAGAPNTIALPTDRPRSADAAPSGARRRARFDRPLLEGLQALARERNATLFMVLLAGFAALLARHSGQDDIVIGSAIAARERRELQDVIGYLTHTLALRTQFAAGDSFDDVLARVRQTCLRAFEHQDVPYERLLNDLDDGKTARGGLFSAMFVLQNASGGTGRLGAATLSPEPADNDAAQFELGLSAAERPDGLHLTMQYRTALFDPATIDALLEHYRVLLAAIVADPSRPLASISLLSPAERHAVLVECNDSAADYPREATVPALIAAQARQSPDAIALTCEDAAGAPVTLTYAELDRRAETLAAVLAGYGVGPGVGVGVCADRSHEAVTALLAVLKAGGYYVPLDPDYPAERLAYMVRDAAIPVLLTLDRLGALVDELGSASGATVVRLDTAWDQHAAHAAAAGTARRTASADDLAYVIYTSGSTGRPKGVMIRHRALVNFLSSMARRPGLAAHDALLAVTTFSFDIAGLELWLPLTVGARIVLAPREAVVDGARLAELLASSGATMLQATPATWRLLLAAGWQGDAALTMLCGGEALPPDLPSALLARGGRLWNMYGPTETTIWSSLQQVRAGPPIGLGEPVANTQLYVLEPSGEPAPFGVPGELWIGGDGVAAGYLNRPDLTAERFVPDPFHGDPQARMYRTGDLVCRRPGGRLEYLGRVDHQVKLRGFRIELDEIAQGLMQHANVADAVVVLREDAPAEPALAAYYVAAGGDGTPQPQELRAHLRALVPEFMLPAFFVALDALPRTPNGKLDRAALPLPDPQSRVRSGAPFVAPRTALETEVAAEFARTLGAGAVGVDDDFFDLGGHSLLAMRLLAGIATATGVAVALRAFFAAPTPAGLAATIAASSPAEPVAQRIARRALPRAPLSRSQELLWLHEQSFPGLNLYNIPIAYRLRGPLDRVALQTALDAVVARHDVLAARFVEHDGEPVQTFDLPRELALAFVDLRALDREERDAAAEARLHAEGRKPFDLARGPVIRATLLRLADDVHILHLVVHHIAFDGPSIAVLLRDLTECYAAARAGRAPELDPLPVQYGDYAAWERATYDGARFDALAAYWRERLLPPATFTLPADKPRPAVERFASARLSIDLPDTLVHGVLQVAREHGASTFMTMLAAFQTLLHRYTGADDVVVGSPASSRTVAETAGLIGYLVNPLAFRGDLAGDPTFAALLERTRDACLDAYEHAALPLEAFVAEDRRQAAEPLFRAMLLVEDDTAPSYRFGEGTLEPVQLNRGVSPFELTLVVRRTGAGMRATLHYRPSLLETATAQRMLEHLRVLLGGIAEDPARALSALPLLPAAERRRLVEEWNATSAPLRDDVLLHQLVEEQVTRTPDAIAVVDERRSVTYAELDAQAGALARRLRARADVTGALVGISSQRSVELVVGLLAILKAGAAYVPLDPEYPADRLAFMLEDSAVQVVLADASSAARLPLAADRIVPLEPSAAGGEAAPTEPLPRVDPSAAAYMIYTSGSTGRPKGALNAHRAICNRLQWGQTRYRLDASDVVLQKTPFSFDISVWELFWPLMTGARLVMAKPGGHREAAYLIDAIVAHGVTVVHFVPSMLRAFLSERDVERCTPVRHVMCSGEALAPDLPAAFFARLDAQLHNLYGPTEAAIEVTHWTCPRDWEGATVPIGRPVANTRAYVLDPHGAAVPIGVPGELHIGGVQVGMGYHGRPELTAERFVPDPFDADPRARLYRTGDLVRYRSDGNIEYLGRLDHQVKLRGYRIELGEIESTLLASGAVRDAAVLMRDDLPGGPVLVAYYVAAAPPAGGETIDAMLRRDLRATLPEYMVPTHFVPLEQLPLSPNGKLDRKALPAPDAGGSRSSAAAFVAPRSATEAVVARIFAEVLGRPVPVGVDDDFFELGGHSLLAMRVVARASKLLRGTLSVRNFFEDPTVGGIAAALRAGEPVPGQVEAIAAAVRAVQEMTPEERRRRSEGAVT